MSYVTFNNKSIHTKHNCECKDCTKRQVGCHSHCKSYLTWKKEYLIEKRKEIDKKIIDRYSYSKSDSYLIYKRGSKR